MRSAPRGTPSSADGEAVTVSTPPSNPHPYPWMNSLFQDGATISWLLGESLAAMSTPESARKARALYEPGSTRQEPVMASVSR